MSEKVFDRLDLLNIFQESGSAAMVGRFRGWKTTDDRGEQLREPQPVVHEVFANIVAYYCEKGQFAIIRRTVQVSQEYRLDAWRDSLLILSQEPVWEAVNNVTTNADLMRRIVDMADVWRQNVLAMMPEDLPKPLGPEVGMLPFDEATAQPTDTDGDQPEDEFDAVIAAHHPND